MNVFRKFDSKSTVKYYWQNQILSVWVKNIDFAKGVLRVFLYMEGLFGGLLP